MINFVLIFVSFVAISSAAVAPCGDKSLPMPKSVKIDDCETTDERCSFYRGSNMKAVVEFTALSDLSWLIPQVNVTVGGIKAETTLPSNRYEGCDWLTEDSQKCPIPRGKDATWRLVIPIVLTDPLVPLSMEVILIGSDEKPQFCFSLKGKIVA